MIRAVFAGAALVMLAACGGGEPAAPASNEMGVAENGEALNYQAAVLDLPPGQRDVVMIRAIRDAGIECQQVTGSEQIKGEGLVYRAKCGDGASHVVAIAADGNAQVISAGAAADR
ncbi:hypothetical protein [Sphingomonas sp.]|uniref:hypothetical protein n=1 Tax=Sphingomonas sp. TaxID=28214 RepID=UPI002C3F0E78|nr:hypothetical protein [Sphingomonas sp.]HTG38666.1 hypothetical protein [Sphingomonas sp.]